MCAARPRPAQVVLVTSLVVLTTLPAAVLLTGAGPDHVDVGSRAGLLPPIRSESPVPLAREKKSSPAFVIGIPPVSRPPVLRPASISLPSLGLAAPADPVGVDQFGQAGIPTDVNRVGWYRYGSAPTDNSGSTVVIGHRDGRGQGRGVFYRLGDLGVGDPVLLTLVNGAVRRYRVVSRQYIAKSLLPAAELFARNGRRRLTLISCGGDYDSVRGYADNVVVTAVPVTA